VFTNSLGKSAGGTSSRRSFAAICGSLLLLGALAAPTDSRAQAAQAESRGQATQPVKLRFQSVYPPTSAIFEAAQFWAARVKTLTGGRVTIEMLPAGAIVPPFEVLDAVNKKVLDGGHSVIAYWVGKNRAATLFGDSPGGPYGMNMWNYLGWLHEGGGMELYREFYKEQLKMNVFPIPSITTAEQALGWFKRPVTSWADLKGRKCRETGVTQEVFAKSGMTTVNMPGGEIVPSGQRGVIDCAEFVGASEDMKIGLHTVWKHFYPMSTHNPSTLTELLVNGDVWASLSPDVREIMLAAASEATLRSQLTKDRQDADALIELKAKHGVTIHRTPDDVLKKILESWDQIAAEESAKNPFFKKVHESQRSYAAKVVPARRIIVPPYENTANHYWPEKK